MSPLSGPLLRIVLLSSNLLTVLPSPTYATDVTANASNATVRLFLSDLPPQGTASYLRLREHADGGAPVPLAMTHSEVWTIPADRLTAFRIAASAAGANVADVAPDPNRPLTAMDRHQAISARQKEMISKAMDSPAAMRVTPMSLPDAKAIEFALVGDPSSPANTITLPLEGTTSVTVVRQRIEKTSDGYVWHGTVAGTEDPVTLIWHMDGRLTGQITSSQRIFSIRHLGNGLHGVIEMQSRMLPPEHAPMDKGLQKKMNMRDDPLVTKGDASLLRPSPTDETIRNQQDAASSADSGTVLHAFELILPPPINRWPDTTIDVLVAYTRGAAAHYMNIEQDLIELAIEDANQSFRNSGIGNVHLRLVYTYETDYTESGTHFEHVFRFADKDGEMDEVHALRDARKADVAILVVDDAKGCGLAAGVAPPQDRAFAVVSQQCAATKFSIAHEIGHIIGARHDAALDDSTMPFSYGHGFVSGKSWRTIMSYENSCDGCSRLPLWSNPRLVVRGVPAGDETADNARVIAQESARVASFR